MRRLAVHSLLALVFLGGFCTLLRITVDRPPTPAIEASAPSREPPPGPAAPPTSLPEAEARARARAARGFLELGRLLVRHGHVGAGRREWENGQLLDPEGKELRVALRRIEGISDDPDPTPLFRMDDLRAAPCRRGLRALAPVVREWAAADRADRLDALIRVMMHTLDRKEVRKTFSLVWFEPYVKWILPADAERLEAGWEYLDGRWTRPEEVARRNAHHSSWTSPWVLCDDVHTIRAPGKYRTVRAALSYTSEFRRMLVKKFGRAFGLKTPRVKLPVLLCRGLDDYRERVRTRYRRDGRYYWSPSNEKMVKNSGGVYLSSAGGIGRPILIRKAVKPDGEPGDYLWGILRHELTHQILFEYLAHRRPTNSDHDRVCLTEAIAEYMECYHFGEDGWEFHPGDIRWAKETCRRIGWAVAEPVRLIRKGVRNETIPRSDAREALTCVAAFMLNGGNQTYRSVFLELIEANHTGRADETREPDIFRRLDVNRLTTDWNRFVYGTGKQELALMD